MVRTSTSRLTWCAFRRRMNSFTGRVECPIVMIISFVADAPSFMAINRLQARNSLLFHFPPALRARLWGLPVTFAPLANLCPSFRSKLILVDPAEWNQEPQHRPAPEQPRRADLNDPVLLSRRQSFSHSGDRWRRHRAYPARLLFHRSPRMPRARHTRS